jgi:2-polyprenyl-3-methyl-5-hydroxy-6-metoxy-1,4-benzoquinol methylase
VLHDLSLHSGERQTASTFDDIRADHRFRYEWVDARVPMGGFGVDAFCGNGYGAWLLAQRRSVWGIDASAEAIAQAERHFKTPHTLYTTAYYPFPLPKAAFDFVVSLESVEHVQGDASFMKTLIDSLKLGGFFAFSTPCEDSLPLASTGNHFHRRHYTLEQTLTLAQDNGLELLEWAGQTVYAFLPDGRQGSLVPNSDMRLHTRTPGQFILCLSRKRSQS